MRALGGHAGPPLQTPPFLCKPAHGGFSRDVPLPSAVNQDQIRATFKNGILTIEIPKSKEAVGKEIKIEAK
ncbi:MAG TPA: Hsp20 family protein [Candidatus Manganitrophaceae bacterium]|nr:Hsp20 family protein [Candidatus Manganitrophaceae bacterium]